MRVGYARSVSDSQVKRMEEAKVDKMVFGVSSQSNSQEHFREFIESLDEQDVLLIDSLAALGDTIEDIIENLTLLKEREVSIQVLQLDAYIEEVKLQDLNTQKILKHYLIHALQIVEENIRLRTSIGAKYMKDLSVKKKTMGRPKKYSEDAENPYDRELYYAVRDMLEKNVNISDISHSLDISRTTIYRIKDELEKDDHIE